MTDMVQDTVAGCVAGRAGDSDRELLERLRHGRADAFAQLMRRYNRLLFRAARGIVADDAAAQDAVQETYLRAFLGMDRFRGDASVATWLTRIVINQALRQQRQLGRLVGWDEEPGDQEDRAMLDPSCLRAATVHDATPEEAAARRQLKDRLEQAIDLLPPIYRCVFILRAVQDLSVHDTAAALQVSEDVVKTRFLRARGLMRKQLDGTGGAQLSVVHDFEGPRCNELVRQVLARLRLEGVVRDQ